MQIEFEHPKFELESKIWVVCAPNHSIYTTITSFRGTFFKDRNKKISSFANEVRIDHLVIDEYFDDFNCFYIPLKYLTYDEEEAKRWMKVYPVLMSEDDWVKAIGQRPTFKEIHKAALEKTYDSADSLEESELGSCCANISGIRTLLIKCKEYKGLIGWERETLQKMLENSCYEIPEQHDLLDKIFSQLDVKWE